MPPAKTQFDNGSGVRTGIPKRSRHRQRRERRWSLGQGHGQGLTGGKRWLIEGPSAGHVGWRHPASARPSAELPSQRRPLTRGPVLASTAGTEA
jgi:hypothetical protein